MSPGDLAQVLRHLPPGVKDQNLIVGFGTSDDAGVYRLNDDIALVQTVDFFTPIVDDPYDFGRIAAANALSDVYAMGGRPLTVMNLAGFPVDDMDLSILADILAGGSAKIDESGAVLVGGHTIDDLEPKYGLSVTGLVHPDRVMQNSTCRPGDDLWLTKPIGTGIVTTAVKRGLASPELVKRVTEIMATLNKRGAEAMLEVGAHACTDITGFGLCGHALEMAKGSGVDIVIDSGSVPYIPEALTFAVDGVIPGGTENNLEYVAEWVDFGHGVAEHVRYVLCDAMTSGGLLISVAHDKSPALLQALTARGVDGRLVGHSQTGTGRIKVI
jgi:selenide, water dikinase